MKKFVVLIALLLVCGFAHADIFDPIGAPENLKASEGVAISGVDPGTILADAAKITGYLGVREGYFYDWNQKEFANYAAATIVTYVPWGLSVNFGVLNADGIGASVDFNIGSMLPAENVPVLNLFQYFYAGFGIGERYLDQPDGNKGWDFAYGPTGEFKLIF